MTVDIRRLLTTTGWFAAGVIVAFSAPATALAAPEPAPPVLPVPDPVVPAPPAPDVAVVAAPAEGTPHLASPDALPVGTTMDPALAGRDPSPHTSYLRDLWQAVQSREISGKEAVILGLSQRNINTPIPQQAPGPNVPIQYPQNPVPVPAPLPPAPAVPAPPAPAPLP
ncbi:hypothetical protein [Mycobacterium sp. C31M]